MRVRRVQSGFTFIELMGVIAILGILACIMSPAIKNYTAKAKVTEAVQAMAACRTPVTEIFLSGSPSDPLPTEWGCEKAAGKASRYVESIEVIEGTIRVQTSGAMGDLRISPKYVTLAPIARAGHVMTQDDQGEQVYRWRCGAVADGTDADLDFSLLPNTCRGF